jgi:hypothetical protein
MGHPHGAPPVGLSHVSRAPIVSVSESLAGVPRSLPQLTQVTLHRFLIATSRSQSNVAIGSH